ncbi:25500_t:CDS:2 [Gigaspora margarita]|uniref:25500_t:CDS:1 n=1 Tax=Gigaspora margarita TaxID=4874 RepID=A0ABM8VZZ3_GIGMA|nr:25500_t:CDS:2 [Gigaspora margarita]
MYPDYEFHPHRDKSVLKIKMNHGSHQKKKKNPVEKPDQRNRNLLIHQDSTISSPIRMRGNSISTTYALQYPINDESDARMGSQDELMEYPVSPITSISPDCPMLIVTGSEVSSPYPSPIANWR